MIRSHPRSTRLTHAFPTRRASDLGRSACERQKGRPISDHSLPLSSSRSDAIVPSYLSLHCSPRTIRTPADWPRPPRRLEWRCESRTPPYPIRASGPRGGLRRAAPLTCTARSRWRDSLLLLADGEGACVPRNKPQHPFSLRPPASLAVCPRPLPRLAWRCESRTTPRPILASGPSGGFRRAAPLTCTARSRWRDSLPLLADGEGACVPRNKPQDPFWSSRPAD